MHYLEIIIIAAVVLLVAKFLLKVNTKSLISLLINILLGIIVIWLVNMFGSSLGIAIPLNFITALVVGILGLPGVIILILLNLIGVI